jgi:hypothetical protein
LPRACWNMSRSDVRPPSSFARPICDLVFF